MFEKILLPIDLSDPASWNRALPAALTLGADSGAVLHVVTVVPDFGLSVVGSFFEKGFEEMALKEIGGKLTEWVSANVPDGVAVQPHVMHGRVYDQIIHAADKLDVDAIVLGAHAPELSDYLLGPNAARVVRHAKQSVFVVKG
ncbi:universal stress protein [Pontivivens insulae]|uniref:Universal stress protein UP12 n=1 Tax=Pontivivens insulae TaxID=1639689 RepID=A0A2R8AFF1_9RHOB|nr:universal stress protein [Pontivivens insulae]RED12207.1 nucleotide-binding universal stress UspA family protein [Pontivivens insulae]SPF30963.1 Universal stress protein UP12 [Pontivivens insulae]